MFASSCLSIHSPFNSWIPPHPHPSSPTPPGVLSSASASSSAAHKRKNPRLSAIELLQFRLRFKKLALILLGHSKRTAERVLVDYIYRVRKSLNCRHFTF